MRNFGTMCIAVGLIVLVCAAAPSAGADPAGIAGISPAVGQCLDNHICTPGLPPPAIFCRCPVMVGPGVWQCHVLCMCLAPAQSFCCPMLAATCKGLAAVQPAGIIKYKVSFVRLPLGGENCPGMPPFVCCFIPGPGGGCGGNPPPPTTPLQCCV